MNLDDLDVACQGLIAAWNYKRVDIVFYGVPQCHIEAVLHEAAHAASLGLELNAQTPKCVSRAIQALEKHPRSITKSHSDNALHEEAKAWAIEWEVIQRLGLSFELGDVEEGAADQEVPDDVLEGHLGTEYTKEKADTVMGWFKHLVEGEDA